MALLPPSLSSSLSTAHKASLLSGSERRGHGIGDAGLLLMRGLHSGVARRTLWPRRGQAIGPRHLKGADGLAVGYLKMPPKYTQLLCSLGASCPVNVFLLPGWGAEKEGGRVVGVSTVIKTWLPGMGPHACNHRYRAPCL